MRSQPVSQDTLPRWINLLPCEEPGKLSPLYGTDKYRPFFKATITAAAQA
jgi:hypothetical protein